MANQVTRRQMERWLMDNGFSWKSGRRTSLKNFKGHGITITLPGRGSPDLTKKHVGMIMRKLERAGFKKEEVLGQLRG